MPAQISVLNISDIGQATHCHQKSKPMNNLNTDKHQSSVTSISIADIERFFQFLDSPAEIFCYCFLDNKSKQVIKGHGIKYGILPEIIEQVSTYSIDNAFTLHTTLNRMKLSGRKRKDVDSCRVLCVDFDRVINRQALRPLVEANKVHLVVESSPGKYHFYWKLDSALSIENWSILQLGLNQYFDADLNLAQPNHTIRVPGVSRVTKDGEQFMPSIVYAVQDPEPFTYSALLSQFPWILDKAEEARTKQKADRRIIGKASKHLVAGRKINYEVLKDTMNRNDTLYSLLYSVASNILEDTTEAALCQIATEYNQELIHHPKGPLDQDEIDKTVRSAYEHGLEKREEKRVNNRQQLDVLLNTQAFNNTNGHGHHKDAMPIKFEYDYSYGDMASNRFSDKAACEMVLQKFKNHLVRVGKTVYAFDSACKVWRSQKGVHDIVQEFASKCLDDMSKDPELLAQRCTNDAGEISPAKVRREKDRLSSLRLISQVCTYVLNSADIRRVTFNDFDTDPYLFYASNGVVDLMTGAIREAQATDMLLRQAKVVYNRDAKCPYFENFISEIYRDNQAPIEVIRFIQELFGYSLTGDTEEQTLFIHVGDGANGKSRLLGALASLLGEYSTRLDPQALTKNKNSMERELSRIGVKFEGKRVMLIDDLDTKSQWNDNLVKTLTDNTIQARKLYEEERDIPNRAKIHIGCNQTPNIENGGKAMDRRICIIEYPRQFEPSPNKYKEIVEEVNRELSGILNWAIKGFKRIQTYQDKKTKWPEEVYIRVEEYQEANAPVQIDLEMLFERSFNEADGHTLDEIMVHVKNYCSRFGVPDTFSKERIGKMLKNLNFEKSRSKKCGVKFTVYFLKFKNFSSLEHL